jgi:hypothetical protein
MQDMAKIQKSRSFSTLTQRFKYKLSMDLSDEEKKRIQSEWMTTFHDFINQDNFKREPRIKTTQNMNTDQQHE